MTIDEKRIHHYTPESREGSKQWVKPGESATKRLQTQQSSGKVMASVFWNARGIIFVDYLEKRRILNDSGRLLNFISSHPFQNKVAIIKCLVDRDVCLSHETFHSENLDIVRKFLF